jgi:cell division protein FtsL
VIASQAVRLVSASPGSHRSHARRAPRAVPLRREAVRRAVTASSWDLRIFGSAIAAIVFCFALAVVYVSQTTALSVAGYDVQKLAAQRDELRRQNSLLEVQSARLDSPARIAADAQRLGMLRARYVPVIAAQPLIAKR